MKKKIIFTILFLFIFSILVIGISSCSSNLKTDISEKLPVKPIEEIIKEHYSKNVKTNKASVIYNEKLENVGKINKNVHLELLETEINKDTLYFQFQYNNKTYNIKYGNVDVYKNTIKKETRHKNYVPFDESIVTKKSYELFKDKKSVYKFNNGPIELPIYIKEKGAYGVVIDDILYFIKSSDVEDVKYSKNAKVKKEDRIPTFAYHFIYDPKVEKCDEIICHTIDQVEEQLDYLKKNNYFTLTMDEFEMFIDKKLNVVDNSILLTLDDGWFAMNAKKLFTEKEMNLSMFIVSSWFDPTTFVTDYVEVHSHSHDMHNVGACPKGQGGGIQCLDEKKLLEDFKLSRERTLYTTAFCYPFYEYNEYTISVLKKAGFTLGFGGLYEGGSYKTYPGYDKFRIPRITLLSTTTLSDLEDALKSY